MTICVLVFVACSYFHLFNNLSCYLFNMLWCMKSIWAVQTVKSVWDKTDYKEEESMRWNRPLIPKTLWPWTTKSVLSSICIFVAIANIMGQKLCMKICSKFPTVSISKLLFLWVDKDFIWTSLKVILSIFRFFLHPQILNF